MAAVWAALLEAAAPEFTVYQGEVLRNAAAFSAAMEKEGFRIVSGGTDNHLFLVDLGAHRVVPDDEIKRSVATRKPYAKWVAEETLGIALYCALRHGDDYAAAVRAAVNISGDSDSTGAVTGAIVGAALGLDAIPAAWREQVADGALLAELGRRLTVGPRETV